MEEFVEELAAEFLSPDDAEQYLDSIAFVASEFLRESEAVVSQYLDDISRVALMYSGDDQVSVLKTIDCIFGEAKDEPNSNLRNSQDFRTSRANGLGPTGYLLRRASNYLNTQHRPLALPGLEKLARETLLYS